MDFSIEKSGLITNTATENINILNLQTQPTNPFTVEIPFVFLGLDIGPEELSGIAAEKVTIDNNELQVISNVTVHKPNNNNQRIKLSGEMETLPLEFDNKIETEEKILRFYIDIGNFQIREDYVFSTKLRLLFRHSRALELLYSGRLDGNLKILDGSLNRISKPKRTRFNLTALLLLFVGLSSWNFFIDESVHNQNAGFWNKELITIGIGVLFTFFGMTLTKIKPAIRKGSNLISFFKYPEIHLNLEQFIGFSSKTWTWLLAGGFIVATAIIAYNWPVNIIRSKHLTVYYSKNNILENKEIEKLYLKDIKKGVFEVSDKNHGLVSLGRLNVKSWPEFELSKNKRIGLIPYAVELLPDKVLIIKKRHGSIVGDALDTFKINSLDLVKSPRISGVGIPSSQLLAKKGEINDYNIEYDLDSSPKKIILENFQEIERDSLELCFEDDVKPIFKDYGNNTSKLFKERVEVVKKAKMKLETLYGNRKSLSIGLLNRVTNNMTTEITGNNKEKKIIERLIFLSALWESSEDRRIDSLNKSEVILMSQNILAMYQIRRNWRVAWATSELLLKLNNQLSSHNKIPLQHVGKMIDLVGKKQRLSTIADLVFIAAKEDQLDNKYINDSILKKEYLKQLDNIFDLDFYSTLKKVTFVSNNRILAGDTYLDENGIVQSRVKDFCRKKEQEVLGL